MIIFGGYSITFKGWDMNVVTNYSDGARYNPATDEWHPISSPGAIIPIAFTWTGRDVLMIGENSQRSLVAFSYNPNSNRWNNLNSPPAAPDRTRASVWTGDEWILLGSNIKLMRFRPASGQWTTNSVPSSGVSDYAKAVWTGAEILFWGINSGNPGHALNPVLNTWRPLSSTNAPYGRYGHSAVWTGTEMLIFGGQLGSSFYFPDFDRYNPTLDQWSKGSIVGAPPSARFNHIAVWTGKEMLIYGGRDENGPQSSGGRYNPITDTWTKMNDEFFPVDMNWGGAVWTGRNLILWGGETTRFTIDGRVDYHRETWIYNPEPLMQGVLLFWGSYLEELQKENTLELGTWTNDPRTQDSWRSKIMIAPSKKSEFFRLQIK